MNARISNLHKTEAEWLEYPDFVPNAGEIIIYDSDANFNYVRLKIGDGKTTLKDLNFIVETVVAEALKQNVLNTTIDSGRITNWL